MRILGCYIIYTGNEVVSLSTVASWMSLQPLCWPLALSTRRLSAVLLLRQDHKQFCQISWESYCNAMIESWGFSIPAVTPKQKEMKFSVWIQAQITHETLAKVFLLLLLMFSLFYILYHPKPSQESKQMQF